MITRYYKGRLTMVEALQQPISFIHYLYYSAVEESKTDEGKKMLKAEATREVLGGMM